MTTTPDVMAYIDESPLFDRSDIEREKEIQKYSNPSVKTNLKIWTHLIAAAAGGVTVLLLHKVWTADNLRRGGKVFINKI